ncbi:MAG: S41 family peptidase [Bacteroidetes bacterium]|nr:S41 family peptidase [Bacteroidota bacterium]MBP6638902.1 S41 family peptidase [Bacteroidia bacterium]
MNRNLRYGLFAAILVMVGMLVGFQLKDGESEQRRQELNSGLQKFQEAVLFVERNYVKVPDTKKMVDDAIQGMLTGLDPHSFYIASEEMEEMEEQMEGSFEGVGIEFNLVEDTIYIVAVISGGPSEIAGLQAGDRIVKIQDTTVAGVSIANNDVMKKLRGKKGTHVKVSVKRPGMKQLVNADIVRDKIPLYSVDYSYMMDSKTGYLKISRFASTTHDEFREHTQKLLDKGMKSMVLDLRGNPGGYMNMAENIADEFLPAGRTVVYTEGRIGESRTKYKASSDLELFEEGALVVLLDYGSASASEIVAGAIQDWDRGLIVGVRSFGKGLVQTQKDFADGSAMRLVISQYYTPSGRCIQKPFNMSAKEYDMEVVERFESGEIYDASKIDLPDSLKFKTNSGRTVYGGGGILPDVFVARDTTLDSDYLTELIAQNIFRQFAFHYGDMHTDIKTRLGNAQAFNRDFRIDETILNEFTAFAEAKGVKLDPAGLATSRRDILIYVKAFIGRRFFDDDAFYPTFHESDNVLRRAVELLPQAKELSKTGKFELK